MLTVRDDEFRTTVDAGASLKRFAALHAGFLHCLVLRTALGEVLAHTALTAQRLLLRGRTERLVAFLAGFAELFRSIFHVVGSPFCCLCVVFWCGFQCYPRFQDTPIIPHYLHLVNLDSWYEKSPAFVQGIQFSSQMDVFSTNLWSFAANELYISKFIRSIREYHIQFIFVYFYLTQCCRSAFSSADSQYTGALVSSAM